MFDANMRHLPKDLVFFAEVYSAESSGSLGKAGVKRDDIVLCKMLDDDNDECRVLIQLKNEKIILNSRIDWKDYWLVYAGLYNGKDFTNNQSKAKAKELLSDLGYSVNTHTPSQHVI